MPEEKGMFAGLAAIIASAVAAVALVFAMFNSLLSEFVPPFEDSAQTVGFVSFGTVVVLLALTLLVQKRLTAVQGRTFAVISVVLFLITIAVYFPFRDFTRTYIYRFPPASSAHDGQTRHIRGELHERGIERVKEMTIAQAVYQLGGPDQVNAMGSLWHEQSRLQVVGKMERFYVALIMLLTIAIFVAGLAVWRRQSK